MRTCTTHKSITLSVELELPVTIHWEEADDGDRRTWMEPVRLEADGTDADLAALVRAALANETASDYAGEGDTSHAEDGGDEQDADDDGYIADRAQERADERNGL